MELPPQLQVTPAQFGAAAGQGAQLNLSRDQLSIQAAEAAQRIALANRQIDVQNQNDMMHLAAAKDQADREFQLKTTQMAVETELQKQKLNVMAQSAAKDFQDRQQYQDTYAQLEKLHPELTPQELMFRTSAQLGIQTSTTAALAGALKKDTRPASDITPGQKIALQAFADAEKTMPGTGEAAYKSIMEKIGEGVQPAATSPATNSITVGNYKVTY